MQIHKKTLARSNKLECCVGIHRSSSRLWYLGRRRLYIHYSVKMELKLTANILIAHWTLHVKSSHNGYIESLGPRI